MSVRRTIIALSMLATLSAVADADDAEIARLLRANGADVMETKGMVTSVTVRDSSKWSDADFKQIGLLPHLKSLSLSGGLDDGRLALLSSLAELEILQTNLAQITDDGIKPLAGLKKLRNLKFFHPGKAFTGAGLVHLAELPGLHSLTVAGSLSFNDEGMAAVARLSGLKEVRTWHAGGTDAGVKHLRALKNLTSLNLGQRLTYKPPACPTDDTVAIVAEMTSLESLQLDEARLSFASLQQLKKLPALARLKLSGIDIARDDVSRLQKALPHVKIEWTEPNEIYLRRIHALFGRGADKD